MEHFFLLHEKALIGANFFIPNFYNVNELHFQLTHWIKIEKKIFLMKSSEGGGWRPVDNI